MVKRTRLRIQEACDDVYSDPDDEVALGRLRRLLSGSPSSNGGAGALVSPASWRRLVKIACDELHDDPEDRDAVDRLLLLLAAGNGLAPAVA